ncbi:MAG: CHAD domain-containing protein [Chloroflexota bacterium]
MTAPSQLLLDALEKRWKTYLAERKRCRTEFSNEAVHDLRVALRRLLSLIQLLNSVEPRPRLCKLSRALKNQLDDFDELRDTQVMLAEISETIHDLPVLEPLQHHLERKERRLLKDLRKQLKNLDLKEIARRIRKTRDALTAQEKADWGAPLLRSVDDAFQIVRQRLMLVEPAQPATIHRVRIAFKKFRYMVEIIHPLLEDFPEENLRRMNEYQTLMGEIQDAEVFLQTLADFETSASSTDLEPVRRHYAARHADAVSAYLQTKDMLHTFWRTAPEEPFPWEKTK